MITKDKVIEFFCIIDEFDKNLNVELSKNLCLPSYNSNGKRCRNRKGRLSESEIMAILVCYHFGTYRMRVRDKLSVKIVLTALIFLHIPAVPRAYSQKSSMQ